ncbi:MAG: acyl carrier protein, partial [Gemmatimonadales bacterium]
LLASDVGQVGVFQIAWPVYLSTRAPGEPSSFFERLAGDSGATPRTDEPRAEPTDSQDPLVDYLRGKVAGVLGVPSGEIRDGLALTDLGLDSLGAMVLANRIRDDLGKGVSMATIIESPSLQALATAIAGTEELPGGMHRLGGRSPVPGAGPQVTPG